MCRFRFSCAATHIYQNCECFSREINQGSWCGIPVGILIVRMLGTHFSLFPPSLFIGQFSILELSSSSLPQDHCTCHAVCLQHISFWCEVFSVLHSEPSQTVSWHSTWRNLLFYPLLWLNYFITLTLLKERVSMLVFNTCTFFTIDNLLTWFCFQNFPYAYIFSFCHNPKPGGLNTWNVLIFTLWGFFLCLRCF